MPTRLFTLVLAVCAALGSLPAEAAGSSGLARTHSRHLEPPHGRHEWKMAPVNVPYSTVIHDVARRGVILADERRIGEVGAVDRGATELCRKGGLKRYGGGIANLGGNALPAARAADIIHSGKVQLLSGVYVFLYEGSSRCTVYRVAER